MVARKKKYSQSGQSLIEFALLIPVVLGFFVVIIQAEQAISAAINFQKYTRSQLHFLSFNHRYYPLFSILPEGNEAVGRYWIGMSSINHYTEQSPVPEAPVVKVGKGPPPPGDDSAQTEYSDENGTLTRRQNVRIRVLSFICLAPYAVNSSQLFTENNLGEESFTAGRFPYCTL